MYTRFRVQPAGFPGCIHVGVASPAPFPVCLGSARGSVYTVCHLANEQSPLGIRHPWFLKPWAVRSPTLLPQHPYVSPFLSLSSFDPHNLPSSTPSFPSRSPSTFTLTASSLRLSLPLSLAFLPTSLPLALSLPLPRPLPHPPRSLEQPLPVLSLRPPAPG